MGSLEGVVDTRAVWIGSREVVEVRYRPGAIGYDELLAAAVEHGCTDHVWTTTPGQLAAAKAVKEVADRVTSYDGGLRAAKGSDQLYYLERSPLRFLPLSPLQARRVNGALYGEVDPAVWLSPRQQELLAAIEASLSASPAALDELERPRAMGELAKYRERLRARLGGD